jgi:hypothetical protein
MAHVYRWRRGWDCCGHRGRRPVGLATNVATKIAPGDFVEPAFLIVRGFKSHTEQRLIRRNVSNEGMHRYVAERVGFEPTYTR